MVLHHVKRREDMALVPTYEGKSVGFARCSLVDGTVGYLRTTRDVPPRGTQWNYTFSFGPGIDVPICHNTHMLIGSSYHHISNALGRQSQRNPSQNEVRLWLGFEWTW